MTFYLKKCTRIYIHMNLLTAFMLRTLMYIWAQFNIAYSKNGTESHYPYLNNLSKVLDNYEFDQLKKGCDFEIFENFEIGRSYELK